MKNTRVKTRSLVTNKNSCKCLSLSEVVVYYAVVVAAVVVVVEFVTA